MPYGLETYKTISRTCHNTGERPMTIYKPDAISVDINAFTAFQPEHLKTHKDLIVERAYPWLFGDKLLPTLQLEGDSEHRDYIDIINKDDINLTGMFTSQGVRAGGKNHKFKQIAQDVREFGFKLMHPAICLFRMPNGELIPMNGRTRLEILVHQHNFTNIIAIIYEAKPEHIVNGGISEEVLDDLSQFGLLANSHSDPQGDLQLEDVYLEVCNAIARKWIKDDVNPPGSNDYLHEQVKNRVETVCGEGCFSPSKRSELIFRILNTNNPNFVVKSWTSKGLPQQWLKKNGYKNVKPTFIKDEDGNVEVDKRGIMYVCLSAATASKGIISAASTAFEFKNYDIKIIVHTGTLTGFDLEKCYEDRVQAFRDFYNESLMEMGYGYFARKSATKRPIELLGALPAVGSYFVEDPQCNKLVKYVTKTILNDMTGLEVSL